MATYDEVMKSIKAGLTGDPEKDIKYLDEISKKYVNHEQSQEILRACGRMIYELLPEEAKGEIGNIGRKQDLEINSVIDEAHFAIFNKDFKRALELLEPLVKEADENPMYRDDSVSEYHEFSEFFEEILYDQLKDSEKDVRKAEYPFATIYYNYGAILFEFGNHGKAKEYLEKAMKWNPVKLSIRFEYMENLKKLGEIEWYGEQALKSFQYAFNSKDLARCYRNLAYYFVEKKKYSEALGCLQISMSYENSNNAQAEMYYISQQSPNAKVPDMKEFEKISEKYGFPLGPTEKVMMTALGYGQEFAKRGMKDEAIYCFGIAYELTGNEEIKKTIDGLSD